VYRLEGLCVCACVCVCVLTLMSAVLQDVMPHDKDRNSSVRKFSRCGIQPHASRPLPAIAPVQREHRSGVWDDDNNPKLRHPWKKGGRCPLNKRGTNTLD